MIFFYYTSLFLWESIYFILESESEVVQSCPTLCDPMNVTYQAPWSMGFSKQEYLSGLPFPSPSDLPNPGIEPGSPALQTGALPSEPPGKPIDWVANEQQKLIPHHSRGWVVQDQGARRFSAWWELRSWFIDDAFSLCSHKAEAEDLFYTVLQYILATSS